MTQALTTRPIPDLLQWPEEGISRVPMHVFSDPEIYAWEQDLIFRGPTWNFLCLDIEIPDAGDYVTTYVGDSPIIVVRRADGGHQRAGEPLRAQGVAHLLSAQGQSARACTTSCARITTGSTISTAISPASRSRKASSRRAA
jgi:anthranilate 1,2-dioxygenase large subunit/terephthalate 1,2-dioxygenase oxygenase component alpha subunit